MQLPVNMQKIGRYEIKAKLGQGGMATVYRALDPRFKRDVAVKVLPPAYLDNPMFLARFEREAQVIAALEFPGIVPVYDFGEDQGQPYLVMRYMPGGSLADRIGRGAMSLPEIKRIIARLAPALDQVHAQGIIHRDLKPGNILFDQYDSAYISDFGIARLTETAVSLTGEALIGTPAYMSPEQAQGVKELDGRSDIYALGAILFEMLTGKQPYEATTPMGVILKHITDPVPRISSYKTDLPLECETIISRAMEKDPERRYPTASAMAMELSSMMDRMDITGTPAPALEGSGETPKGYPRPAPSREGEMDQLRKIEQATELEREEKPQPRQAAAVQPAASQPAASQPPVQQPVVKQPIIQQPASPPAVSPPVRTPVSAGPAAANQPAPGRVSTPYPAAGQARKPATTERKMSPILLIGGLGIVALVCIGILSVGGLMLSGLFSNTPTEEFLSLDDTSTIPTVESGQEIVPSGGSLIFDDFSDPESGWDTYDDVEGTMNYDTDSYRIYVDLPQTVLYSYQGFENPNVSIQVDAYKSGGPDDNLYGVICRLVDEQNYYFLVVGSDGYFGIGKSLYGELSFIDANLDFYYSDFINQGRTNNIIRADCVGDQLSLYANGALLVTVQDATFSEGGVGLLAGTNDQYGVNILFDNFQATPIENP